MFFNVKLILKVDLFSSIFGSEDSLLTERQKNRKTEKQKDRKTDKKRERNKRWKEKKSE